MDLKGAVIGSDLQGLVAGFFAEGSIGGWTSQELTREQFEKGVLFQRGSEKAYFLDTEIPRLETFYDSLVFGTSSREFLKSFYDGCISFSETQGIPYQHLQIGTFHLNPDSISYNPHFSMEHYLANC